MAISSAIARRPPNAPVVNGHRSGYTPRVFVPSSIHRGIHARVRIATDAVRVTKSRSSGVHASETGMLRSVKVLRYSLGATAVVRLNWVRKLLALENPT